MMPELQPEVERLLEDKEWLTAQLERGLADSQIAELIRARGLRCSKVTVWAYRKFRHRLPGVRERQQRERRRILGRKRAPKPAPGTGKADSAGNNNVR